VSISPGAMALTRMPRGPKSPHLARKAPPTPLRGGVGRARERMDREPAIEVTLTTDPWRLELVDQAARERDGAKKFTRKT